MPTRSGERFEPSLESRILRAWRDVPKEVSTDLRGRVSARIAGLRLVVAKNCSIEIERDDPNGQRVDLVAPHLLDALEERSTIAFR